MPRTARGIAYFLLAEYSGGCCWSCPLSKRRKLILSASGVAILLSLVFYRDIFTAYVAFRFRTASNPESELDAAMLMNHSRFWQHKCSPRPFDTDGNRIKPWESGDWDAVKAVEVTWDNGISVYRVVQHPNTLAYVFGE